MKRVYLDHNATTPLRPEALEAMQRVLRDDFGNPSSVHWAGAAARDAMARARAEVASLLGVAPDTIVFTSGATEASNTVIQYAGSRAPAHGNQVVTCATEHPAVLEVAEEMREQGLSVVVLPVDSELFRLLFDSEHYSDAGSSYRDIANQKKEDMPTSR